MLQRRMGQNSSSSWWMTSSTAAEPVESWGCLVFPSQLLLCNSLRLRWSNSESHTDPWWTQRASTSSDPLHSSAGCPRLRRQLVRRAWRDAARRQHQPVLVSGLQEAASHRPQLHLLSAAAQREDGGTVDHERRRSALPLQVTAQDFIITYDSLCF